jgi:small GTP-binding protein
MTKSMRQLTKKVCLLGDFSVGKTSLIRRFVEGRFDERYLSTIGVKVDRKTMTLLTPQGEIALKMMVWDLAGGPDAGPVVHSYYRGASGAIIACDLTRPETLASTCAYAERFLAANPSAKVIIAANKVDLTAERRLTDEELAAVAIDTHAPLFLTSAKTGQSVEEMFHKLGLLITS